MRNGFLGCLLLGSNKNMKPHGELGLPDAESHCRRALGEALAASMPHTWEPMNILLCF